MITETEYQEARNQRDHAERIIQRYLKQKASNAEVRWQAFLAGEYFTDDDLHYSAGARCHCSAGLAYPKDCPPNHRWDCSDVLKGQAKVLESPHEILPFAFYSIISEEQKERAQGQTSRPAKV